MYLMERSRSSTSRPKGRRARSPNRSRRRCVSRASTVKRVRSRPRRRSTGCDVRAVVIGASIHVGRHQKAAVDFARHEAPHLNARPSAFFSVSLSAGSRNAAEVDAARGLAQDFVRAAGWTPQRIRCFAGKLAYSQYGFLKRQALRFIAWREGAPTDTRRDYEFTDWTAVRQFALDFAADTLGIEQLENRPAV